VRAVSFMLRRLAATLQLVPRRRAAALPRPSQTIPWNRIKTTCTLQPRLLPRPRRTGAVVGAVPVVEAGAVAPSVPATTRPLSMVVGAVVRLVPGARAAAGAVAGVMAPLAAVITTAMTALAVGE
jgi:hypothetical protein